LERHFVVCEVTLSREVRLDRFETVWRKMMENLATPESEGEPEGIEAILNRWCEQVAQSPEQLQQALAELERIPKLDPDFRQALRGYLRAWFEEGDRDPYLQWFKGDPIKPKGVRVRIDRTSARAMLRSLIQFLKHLGYSGLVLFLDELELIMAQGQRVRDTNYDVLRQFIDDADNLSNFLLLCSATPKMRDDDQRGFPSYPALWQRLGGMLSGMQGDYRAITVNLDEAPLSDDDLLELAKRLRTVHSVANAWNAEQIVSDDFLDQLIQAAKQRGSEFSLPRLIVQATISLLEARQQNPEQDLEDLLPDALRDAMESIRQQERNRYRPWE
jgi:AcrR family transcriptional regulator